MRTLFLSILLASASALAVRADNRIPQRQMGGPQQCGGQ